MSIVIQRIYVASSLIKRWVRYTDQTILCWETISKH